MSLKTLEESVKTLIKQINQNGMSSCMSDVHFLTKTGSLLDEIKQKTGKNNTVCAINNKDLNRRIGRLLMDSKTTLYFIHKIIEYEKKHTPIAKKNTVKTFIEYQTDSLLFCEFYINKLEHDGFLTISQAMHYRQHVQELRDKMRSVLTSQNLGRLN